MSIAIETNIATEAGPAAELCPPKQDGGRGSVHLCTKSLCLSYGTRIALDDVSLSIPSRAVTAIIGPSGSGKSSFLCCLNRMTDLNHTATVAGSVCLGERDVFRDLGKNPIDLRRRVGMVFQCPNPFPFSIKKNLTLPLHHQGIRDKRELGRRIETTLRRVGLWEEVAGRLRDSALSLSGGCRIPYDYIGSKIESLLRAREVMELLVSTSAPEEAQ